MRWPRHTFGRFDRSYAEAASTNCGGSHSWTFWSMSLAGMVLIACCCWRATLRKKSKIMSFCRERQNVGVSLDLSIEPVRAGTGGALQFAVTKLDDAFLLLNGDSWFDI